MKKYRLKRWVKIVLTIMILFFSLGIYFKSNDFAAVGKIKLAIVSWMWLVGGQFILLEVIWSKEV